MKEETVPPQVEEKVETVQAVEAPAQEVAEEVVEAEEAIEPQETKVPLAALQKERRKRQEMEIELRVLKEQQNKKTEAPIEQDDSRYESATKEDLTKAEVDILRKVEERTWIKNNPERYEKVNELLPEFLKRRPNLAAAIEGATNRYEEAWELMDKLTPKEQQKLKTAPPKKEAPGSPSAVPKAAALDQAVDVMSMSDAEFSQWRQSRKRRR